MVASVRAQSGFEGEPAEVLAHTGADLERTSSVLLHAKEQADTLAAEDAYNKLRTTQLDLMYGPKGLLNVKGADAVNRDLPAEYGKQLVGASQELSNGLANDYQRQLFARRAAQSQLELQETAFRHVSQQSDVYANQVLNGTLETESRVAAAGGPVAISLVRMNAAIDRHAQRFGLAEEAVTAMKMKAADSLWTSQIKSLIYTDPMAAKKVFDAHATEIGPDNKPLLEHGIRTAVLPIEAKTLAERVIGSSQPQQGLIAVGGQKPSAIVTVRDTRAQLGNWITAAETEAQRLHPDDPTFRDMVVQQVKGYVNTVVAMQDGIAKQAHGTLMNVAMGANGVKPMRLDELLATPQAREAWSIQTPESQRGILALLEHNAREARGEFTASNPNTVQDLFGLIHLPEGDPRQIKSASQLAPFFAKGLNKSDYDWLKKEIDQVQGGSVFTRDVQTLRQTAHRIIMSKDLSGGLLKEPYEEASYRFNRDLQQKIDEYNKAGKDPRSLLTPGSPDYALTPERIASFLPNAKQSAADAARADLPKISSDADYNKLKPGDKYVAPDGSIRTKGGK